MAEVTVVIPLYNNAARVGRALDSVLGQSERDFRVVVVDDGSTDGGADRVTAVHDGRVRLIRQENRGPGAARNRGIRAAETSLIALLDADDEWKPDFLKTVLALRARHPEAGAWVTAYEEIAKDGRTVVRPEFIAVPRAPEGGLIPDFFRSMMGFPPVCCSNCLCPRPVFQEAGYFAEGEPLAEDWDMWTRIALRRPIAFSPRVQAVYHTEGTGRATDLHRFTGKDTCLARTLKQALAEDDFSTTTAAAVKTFLGRHLLEVAKHLIAAGERRRARQIIREVAAYGVLPRRRLRWWIRSFFG